VLQICWVGISVKDQNVPTLPDDCTPKISA
jgi:hypothetical protein